MRLCVYKTSVLTEMPCWRWVIGPSDTDA